MNRPQSGNALTAEQRQALEADYTAQRIVELRLDPVRGNFDAKHLREINRRIFQDLPALGFDDVTPGEYRAPVPPAADWIKNRSLESARIDSHVAYSPMDTAAVARLDQVLQRADPAALAKLQTEEFTKILGELYVELDYIHPFLDGNSRTLREFTRQLAEEAGYRLDWERFNRSPEGRDVLYIARDKAVNALALPHIRHHGTLRDVTFTLDRFERMRSLPDLLREAVQQRESRAPPAGTARDNPTAEE